MPGDVGHGTTFFLFVVLALYRLLRHSGEHTARAMVALVVVAVAIMCLNMVHQLGALLVGTDPSYAAFGGDQSAALVYLLMDLQHHGYLVAQIFFGLWLFPLGLLAWRSGMFPRPIAVLLMSASTAYLLDVALQFLAPGPGRDRQPGTRRPLRPRGVLDARLPPGQGRQDHPAGNPRTGRGVRRNAAADGHAPDSRTSMSTTRSSTPPTRQAKTMRAVVGRTYGSPDLLTLDSIDRPAVGDGDVLVRVHAAGLDQGVWHTVTGLPYGVRAAGFGLLRRRRRRRVRRQRRDPVPRR